MIELMLECLWGGLAGYITNEYAIEHLFRDFGPLKSVISKEQDSLAESLADMVEAKILRGESLSAAIMSPETIGHIKAMINYALKEGFVKSFGEICGFDQAAEKFSALIEAALTDRFHVIWSEALSGIKISDLIKPDEADIFWKELSSADINSGVKIFLIENPSLTLGDFVPFDAAAEVINFIENRLQTDGREIAASLAERLELSNILKYLAKGVEGRQIKDFINGGDERVKEELSRLFRGIASSEHSKKVLDGLCMELFNWLKNAEVALISLFPDGFDDGLHDAAVRVAKAVIPEILDFVDQCDEDILEIIRRSGARTLNRDIGGLLTRFKFVRKLVLSVASDRNLVMAAIRGYLENKLSTEELGGKLADIITDYLKNTTLAELTSELEKKKLVSPETLSAYVHGLIKRGAEGIPDKLYQRFIEFKILHLEGRCDKLSDVIVQCGGRILTENAKVIAETLTSETKKLLQKPLCDILPDKLNLPEKISLPPNRELTELEPPLAFISEAVQGTAMFLRGKHISEVSSALATDSITGRAAQYLRDNVLIDNLGGIFQIRKIIKMKIGEMDKRSLCCMMEKFMGENLRPLCILGAIIGVLVGGGLFFAENAFELPGWISIPAFALIGVVTNMLALFGLFRPYNRTFGIQGFIPSNKHKIAKQTAQLVERELLNPELLKAHYEKSREDIKASLMQKARENNYAALFSAVEKNKRKWAERAASALCSDSGKAASAAAEGIGGFKLKNAVPDAGKILGFIKNNSDKIRGFTEKYFADNSKKTADRLLKRFLCTDAEKVWNRLGDKTLYGLITCDGINALCGHLGEFAADKVFAEKTGKAAAEKINSILNSLDSGDSLGTAFGGAIVKATENHRERIFARLKKYFIELALENREAIVTAVTASAEEKIPPFAAMFINIPAIVGGIIDDAFENELEDFVNKRSRSLEELMEHMLEAYVYPIKLEVLKLKAEKINVSGAVADFIGDEARRRPFGAAVSFALRGVAHEVCGQKISEYMEIFHARSLADADKRLNGALSAAIAAANCALEENGAPEIMGEMIKRCAPQMGESAGKIAAVLAENSAFSHFLAEFSAEIKYSLGERRVSDIIPKEEIEARLSLVLKNGLNYKCETELAAVIECILGGLREVFPGETVENLLDIFADAALLAMQEHLGPLLEDLNVAKITEDSVNKLSGRETEDLFGFAKPFFTSIRLMGAAGVVYGINTYVSIAVTALHFIYKFLGKGLDKSE